jgi:hypothetical protein
MDIDYKDLLNRYIKHVEHCEGIDYVSHINHSCSDITFKDNEKELLESFSENEYKSIA